MGGDDVEEAAVNIDWRERLELPLELVPTETVGFDQVEQCLRQSQATEEGGRAINDDGHRDDAEQQQRIDHWAAERQGLPGGANFLHD